MTVQGAVTHTASPCTRWVLAKGSARTPERSTVHTCIVFNFHIFHTIELEIVSVSARKLRIILLFNI